MNRPIMFRGWDPDTKRWYFGSYARLERSTPYPMSQTPEEDAKKFEDEQVDHYIFFTESSDWGLPTRKLRATADPKSVGQWTGLRDKKGQEIYEGDFLEEMLYVAWCDKQGSFEVFMPGYGENGASDCMACGGDIHWYEIVEEPERYEVIGNTYQNPELLDFKQAEADN